MALPPHGEQSLLHKLEFFIDVSIMNMGLTDKQLTRSFFAALYGCPSPEKLNELATKYLGWGEVNIYQAGEHEEPLATTTPTPEYRLIIVKLVRRTNVQTA